ncbi:MAG: hypothetical protein Q4D76_07620 [Oscillospiraceae bacterium]|nr:hypothetical protein [Oscillospiraceae bacterium]
MYQKKEWVDEVIDVESGETIQRGTPQSAKNFNNIESGILDNQIASSLMLIAISQLEANLAVEEKVETFTNTAKYPFNNSAKTISISNTRTNTNYSVDTEIIEHVGEVGDVVVYDKMINGFKVRFEGSAALAKIKLIVTGGI